MSPKNSDMSPPRLANEIFADLGALSTMPGALHEISAIIYRDWVVTVDVKVGQVVDDANYRWSTSKLNRNELMLLLGLMVKSSSDQIYSVQTLDNTFAARADQLLRELHERILADATPTLDRTTGQFVDSPDSIGLLAREAIYYGADGFYLHQFPRFSRLRYREDSTWLLHNVGFSIRSMIEIASFVVKRINAQMTAVGHMKENGHMFSNGDLTNSLLVSKDEVTRKFGNKATAFFARFLTPATLSNSGFTEPFAINATVISPIIDLGDYLYVPNQYRLFESVYESPFYWMMADQGYASIASERRGAFVEQTAAHLFANVFGNENVHENVTIKMNAQDVAGEIDVLVSYGEFVIIVQAKSKRVTLKARAGDSEALKNDFKNAIDAPYDQALSCIELLRSGAKCLTKNDRELNRTGIVGGLLV